MNKPAYVRRQVPSAALVLIAKTFMRIRQMVAIPNRLKGAPGCVEIGEWASFRGNKAPWGKEEPYDNTPH